MQPTRDIEVKREVWGLLRDMKILVVEDEPLIRLGLATAIEEAGYEVFEAANATEAIRRLEADTEIRLLLTDVDMGPRFRGDDTRWWVSPAERPA